jgi:hypothetical protein
VRFYVRGSEVFPEEVVVRAVHVLRDQVPLVNANLTMESPLKTSGPYLRSASGGWLRAGDTSGSRVRTGWLGSRRKTPVTGCVRGHTLLLVSPCVPLGRPSVSANFREFVF